MKNISVHYEMCIFDLSKMFKAMNIHFKGTLLELSVIFFNCAPFQNCDFV